MYPSGERKLGQIKRLTEAIIMLETVVSYEGGLRCLDLP
jgi:hypothetical protein